jgi:carbon-monoxide dehydrogenase medium subunit
MIANSFEYTAPATLAEALKLLAGGSAKPLSGGMSLIPMMKLRLANPEHLVYIGRLAELDYIREEKDGIHIGAAVTHHAVETAPLLRGKCPLIAETAGFIGDIQVRNMGTIGGSVAHADPAADYPAALQALEAKIVVKSASKSRTIAVDEFFVDTFTTALEPGEIVTEIIVPVDDAATGSSYQKFLQPASGFAIVGVAARIRKQGGNFTMARVGVTGLSGRPYRALATEKALSANGDVKAAAAAIAQDIEANSDLHASATYRTSLAVTYAAKAINAAISRSI